VNSILPKALCILPYKLRLKEFWMLKLKRDNRMRKYYKLTEAGEKETVKPTLRTRSFIRNNMQSGEPASVMHETHKDTDNFLVTYGEPVKHLNEAQ
jgi:hypothetical protein